MENVRAYTSIDCVRSKFIFQRRVARVNFHSAMPLSENTALVRSTPILTVLNKPVYVGSVILELSKEKMISFFYRELHPTFHKPPSSTLSLHATDTDSYIFSVEYPPSTSGKEFYSNFAKIVASLDLSAYPRNHPLYDLGECRTPEFEQTVVQNRGVVGKFKDELGGTAYVQKIVALKPKMYGYLTREFPPVGGCEGTGGKERQNLVAKGIQKYVKKTIMTFWDYERVLSSTLPLRHRMNLIRSYEHQLYIVSQSKLSLSLFDDKRYWVDKFSSLPYHHYRILGLRGVADHTYVAREDEAPTWEDE